MWWLTTSVRSILSRFRNLTHNPTLQADNRPSCLVSEFLHSVAAQLAQAPQIPGYGVQVRGDPRLARLLSPASCAARPATVLARGILGPLSRCAPPAGPAPPGDICDQL